ncbi:hypothetical protein EVAR_20652_1 [Eumeta japonica]|uniref:Uncharacterized protein n=1 Tax=Eumeta variegata TaxID=151549 RepID=A0A4C1VBZ6_EUMVA|nr:hypothetical protein EVAR_20652_1 [Eumeta japonica]
MLFFDIDPRPYRKGCRYLATLSLDPGYFSVLLRVQCPFEPRSECRDPRVYECVWCRAVVIVWRRLSHLLSSRVFTPIYCTVCTPSPCPISAPREHSRRFTFDAVKVAYGRPRWVNPLSHSRVTQGLKALSSYGGGESGVELWSFSALLTGMSEEMTHPSYNLKNNI